MTSRSVCDNTFPAAEQPGGSPTAPPCPPGRCLCHSYSNGQRPPQISTPFRRAEHGFALARHGSPQPQDAPQPVSHRRLGNGVMNILKGPLPAPAGVHPLLCLATSLWPLPSAMVRRMPFPRGREIHGLLPCSKGEAATSRRETRTGAQLSLSGGKSSRSQTLPVLGHAHMAVAMAQQKPLGKVPKVTRPTSASSGHLPEECTSAKMDKRAHRGWQESRGTGGEGALTRSAWPGHITI